jgi:putative FmdB family regulatory protein
MPIYEYRCEQGHTFEVMQRMSDDPIQTCETCEAPVSRVFRPVAVHFKGSGFYNTDYGTRKRAREEGGKEGKGSDDKGSGTDSTPTSDAKPEAKKSEAKASTTSSSAD